MFNLLCLPRVSWKTRMIFSALCVVAVGMLVQQWPHRLHELAIARWIAWLNLGCSAVYLPHMLVAALSGRLPKLLVRLPRRLNRTLPQIRTNVVREQHVLCDRSHRC